MKRDAQGNPITQVHRWNRPPLSCHACREKKRRCDRAQPCSNCVLRNIDCEYSGQSPDNSNNLEQSQANGSNTTASQSTTTHLGDGQSNPGRHNSDELLFRIRRLEEAFIGQSNSSQGTASRSEGVFTKLNSLGNQAFSSHYVTPFSVHNMSLAGKRNIGEPDAPSIVDITRKLPPLWQARELFNHFAEVLQPTYGVLHIPSCRKMMESIYEGIVEGKEPPAADLMLIFSIFAGTALGWTPALLERLDATSEEAKAALLAYSRIALAILDHPARLIEPSTTALIAMGTLGHILVNTDGFPVRVQILRHHCHLMSRELNIHRLDTAKAREERRLKGCNMIDVEVQRRAWWSMVASDWLLSFSGGPQEGAYIFQPKHMNVNMPSNTDDELITKTGIQQEFPLSVATSMSAFHARVQCSDLCRQVIDALPSILLDSQEPNYDTILELDTRFHQHIANLPVYFKLDAESIEQSQQICKERPYIAWQRVTVHFSLHTRLCRLHRQYHLEGITNPKYAYSHMVCIRSAHKVLELRRAMDDLNPVIGLKPARFWTVMHHVFFAALILAMDVSFNPAAPDAAARKAKVLAAYETLEQSKRESNDLMEGIQKNLQTLMSTLHKQRSQTSVLPKGTPAAREGIPGASRVSYENQPINAAGEATILQDESLAALPSSLMAVDDNSLVNSLGEEDWERLWSDFVAVAPDLDVPQWNSLLEDVDFPSNLGIF